MHECTKKCLLLAVAQQSIKDKERIIRELEEIIHKQSQLALIFPN